MRWEKWGGVILTFARGGGGGGGEISIKKPKRCIILSSMVCLAVRYFSTLSHLINGTGKKY